MTNSKIIVSFHIGRGGRYYNGGHVTYMGEKNFQQLIAINNANLFTHNRDEDGKFCKPFLYDCNGNVIVESGGCKSETGTLNFDNEYDTDYAIYIEDCDERELEVIAKSDEIKSAELDLWMKENYKGDCVE